MAKKNFPLQKRVISNQKAKELNDGVFKEIALSEEKFDDEKIKNIYNDLFYLIPKRGKSSHESIVIQSTDYIHPEINIKLNTDIAIKEQALLEKEEEYLKKSLPIITPQNPLYSNGSFLQEGNIETNLPTNPGSDIWRVCCL